MSARSERRALLALLAALSVAGGAEAAGRAEVNVHGGVDEVRELEATLRALFTADTQLQVSAVEQVDGAQVMRDSVTASTEDVAARAWIELHDGGKVTIYVADVSGERILVRHLPRNDDAEIVREATARVVATALEALLNGAQIGVERAKISQELAPPPPPPPAAPPAKSAPAPARDSLAFTLGAQYGLELYSSQVPVVHGPGLVIGGSHRSHATRPGASLLGQLWWPSSAGDDVARVRVYSGALRLLATIERGFGSSFSLNAGFGGGIDLTRVEPRAAETSLPVRLSEPKTLVTPAIRAALGARFRQAWGMALYTTLALDADPSGTRYVSTNDGVTTRLLQPHVLRPSLVLGVATP